MSNVTQTADRTGSTPIEVRSPTREAKSAKLRKPEAGTMPGRHVLVEALDCVSAGEVTELLVHVVCARAGIVANPDAEVLDFQRTLLIDLRNTFLSP